MSTEVIALSTEVTRRPTYTDSPAYSVQFTIQQALSFLEITWTKIKQVYVKLYQDSGGKNNHKSW